MGYPGITKTQGRDFNFFERMSVTWTSFGGGSSDGLGPDMVIRFSTQGVFFLNEDTADILEYSFNGTTVHGELNPALLSNGLAFDNRVICLIWFRIKSGSSGPISIRVDAWANK